jgi:uncharacterized protein RhaS with RHS repeats
LQTFLRYYDPECGRYASQDPIGLAGGENSFEYVTNPTLWIDPLGLASYPLSAISGFQQHNIIPQKLDGSNIFAIEQAKKAGFEINDQSNIIYLPCRRDKSKPSSMTRTLLSRPLKYQSTPPALSTIMAALIDGV